METIEIIGTVQENINLFPQNIVEEAVQNIRMVLSTYTGSVPIDRNFGLNPDFIDLPTLRAQMKARIFILEAIQENEPRVEITEIDFVPAPLDVMDGKTMVKVKVRILDEYIS